MAPHYFLAALFVFLTSLPLSGDDVTADLIDRRPLVPLASRAKTLLAATFLRFTPSSAPCTCAWSTLVLRELLFEEPLSAAAFVTRVLRAEVGVVEPGLVVFEAVLERDVFRPRDVVRSGGVGAELLSEPSFDFTRMDAGIVCRPNPPRTNLWGDPLAGSAARSSVEPCRELLREPALAGERMPGMIGLAGLRDFTESE